MFVRPERGADRSAVAEINSLAFGGPAEARLVDALRPIAEPGISLVAVESDRVVGHVFFSPVTIGPGRHPLVLGLAPLAVTPALQRRGLGSLLTEAGLLACAEAGARAVVVVGHPAYYPRFGFERARDYGVSYPPAHSQDAVMIRELVPGALDGVTGCIAYLPPFSAA
jgi:putative acetyltransferase